jgi:hypothetical protein
MVHVNKMAWLAGLLEGEGCFLVAYSKCGPHRYPHARIDLATTDEDVIRHAAYVMGTSVRAQPVRGRYKQVWRTQAYSHKAQALMQLLFPMMGARRKAKIREILTELKCTKARKWGKRHATS